MPGTKEGGKKAKATILARYGADYYARIGAVGGSRGHTGGFYKNRELARAAGAKGGTVSRRGPKSQKESWQHYEDLEEPFILSPHKGWSDKLKERLWKRAK